VQDVTCSAGKPYEENDHWYVLTRVWSYGYVLSRVWSRPERRGSDFGLGAPFGVKVIISGSDRPTSAMAITAATGQGPRTCGCRYGSTFEQILHIVIVVFTQTSHRHALAISLQFASDVAVLTAVMSLNRETTVGPELALGSETVWCLQQCDQQRQPESGRSKESGEVTSPQDASGSPAVGRVALPDAPVATDPVADRAVGLEPELLVPRSWPTTLRGDVERRRWCRGREWPSFDTGL
jgi:hypothetical protein